MASRIVGLLLSDTGISGALAQALQSKPGGQAHQADQAQRPLAHKGRQSKLTPEVRAFIRSAQGTPVPDILEQISARFGLSLSRSAVYTEWRSAHLPLGTPTQSALSGRLQSPKTIAKSCV